MKSFTCLVVGLFFLSSHTGAVNEINMNICMDLVILVDKSCSINGTDKEKVRQSLLDLVDMFPNVGTSPIDRVRISVVTFSEVPKQIDYDNKKSLVQISFKDGTTKGQIKKAIKKMKLSEKGSDNAPCRTKTWKALNYVWNEVFNKTEAENGNRANIVDVLFMVYDGITHPHDFASKTIANAQQLRAKGIEIFAVAPTNLNIDIHKINPDFELTNIVTPPALGNGVRHLFKLEEDDYLSGLVRSINALGADPLSNYVCALPPDTPLRDDFSPCQDIMILIDTSCSPKLSTSSVRTFLKKFITKTMVLDPVFGSSIGIITFNKHAHTRLNMTAYTNPWDVDELLNFIDNGLVLEAPRDICRTLPRKGFKELAKHFGPQGGDGLFSMGDRKDFKNIVLFIGDLVTFPQRKRFKTLKAAMKAGQLAEIYVIQTENMYAGQNKETVFDKEIATNDNNGDHIFTWVDPDDPSSELAFDRLCSEILASALGNQCPPGAR